MSDAHIGFYDEQSKTPDLVTAGYTTPGWYFWDEAGFDMYGPSGTKSEAETAMARYVALLDGAFI